MGPVMYEIIAEFNMESLSNNRSAKFKVPGKMPL